MFSTHVIIDWSALRSTKMHTKSVFQDTVAFDDMVWCQANVRMLPRINTALRYGMLGYNILLYTL